MLLVAVKCARPAHRSGPRLVTRLDSSSEFISLRIYLWPPPHSPPELVPPRAATPHANARCFSLSKFESCIWSCRSASASMARARCMMSL
jgi:hypothetical protein